MNLKLKITLIFLCLILLFTVRGSAGNVYPDDPDVKLGTPPFETSMERGRYAQIVSLARSGSFNVDSYPDFLKPDLAWYNGHFYPTFPPLMSILSVPLYLAGELLGFNQVFAYLTSSAFLIITGFVMWKAGQLLGLSEKTNILSILVFGLGTCAFVYGSTMSVHTLSAFIITLAYLLFLKLDSEKNNLILYSLLWAIFGLNFLIDYPNIFILFPLLILSFFKGVKAKQSGELIRVQVPVSFFVGVTAFAVSMVLFIWFSFEHYGRPFAFTNSYSLKYLQNSGIAFTQDTLTNQHFESVDYARRFSLAQLADGLVVLLVSSDRGLLFFTPVFVFAIPGLYLLFRRHRIHALGICAVFLFNVLIYASYDDPWGGWAFGPRYLIASMPLLSLLTGITLEHVRKAKLLVLTLFSMLLLFSVSVSLAGALTSTAVPPSVEAAVSGKPDNYVLNFNILKSGFSSSFTYNLLFKQIMTPVSYAIFLLAVIIFYSVWVLSNFKIRFPKIFRIGIALFCIFASFPRAAKATENARWWEVQSIDTMKFSRDMARDQRDNPKFESLINDQVKNIAETGATHVAIGTPYDAEFIPFLKKWVEAARSNNLKVWFRGNWSGWEGWFNYKEISRSEHIELTRQFILNNRELFLDGDIFSSCPECENGGPGDPRFNGDLEGHRSFILEEYKTTKDAFESIKKDVRSNWWSMNLDVAKLVMDQRMVEKLDGVIVIDHYVYDPLRVFNDAEELAAERGAKIVLGEFGVPIPDIHGPMSDYRQAVWISELLARLVNSQNILGLNYWVGSGGSTEIWHRNNAPKEAVEKIRELFMPKTIRGTVEDEFGGKVEGAIVSSERRQTSTDADGEFSIPVLEGERLKIKKDGMVEYLTGQEEINPVIRLKYEEESLDVKFKRLKRFFESLFSSG